MQSKNTSIKLTDIILGILVEIGYILFIYIIIFLISIIIVR